jgi:CubicO group peptidase (beta-lactamase class C family)
MLGREFSGVDMVNQQRGNTSRWDVEEAGTGYMSQWGYYLPKNGIGAAVIVDQPTR